MTKKLISLTLILVFTIIIIGCATHRHIIGNGAQSGVEVNSRQWYILYGLIPLNNVDTKAMAGGASDYEIITKQGVVDILIGMVAQIVTINSRTVTVKK